MIVFFFCILKLGKLVMYLILILLMKLYIILLIKGVRKGFRNLGVLFGVL